MVVLWTRTAVGIIERHGNERSRASAQRDSEQGLLLEIARVASSFLGGPSSSAGTSSSAAAEAGLEAGEEPAAAAAEGARTRRSLWRALRQGLAIAAAASRAARSGGGG